MDKWTVTLHPLAEPELLALPADMQARFVRIAEMLEDFGPQNVGLPHIRPLESKLWEMRMKGRHGIGAGGAILYEHPASAIRAGLQTTWYRCWCSSQRSRKRRLAGVCPADVADTLPEWLAIGVQHGYAANNELAKRTHHSHRRAIRPVARFKGKRDGEVVVLGDERTDNALVCVRKEGEGVAGHVCSIPPGTSRGRMVL